MEKSYCQFSNSGGSWHSFPEPEEESDSEGENNNVLQERHATLLPRNEMQLYGHCPAHDNFSLVTCNECGKILKTLLFTKHCEIHHKNLLSSIPTQKPLHEVKRNKNIKVMQPKVVINKLNMIKTENMDIDTIDVKIEEVPPVIPKFENTGIPEQIVVTTSNVVTNHAMKKSNSLKKGGKDSPRKFLLTKDREYDPNRHCGVWVEELQKNCTRSLTCKTHALSLRRAVPGRIKEFDVLLLEHRERVNLAKEQQLLCNAQNVSSNSTGSYGNRFSDQRNGLASQAFSGGGQSKDVAFNLAFKSQHSNLDDDQSDLQYLTSHPKPLACCKFGARRAGPGHYVFNRRSDHLRTTVLSMVERLLHPSQSRHTVGKHSVHRRYNTKTAGQSSSQGSNIRIDTPNRARSANTNAAPTNSTVFRNSNKQKTSRQTSSERGSQSNRPAKQTHSGNREFIQQTTAQRSSIIQGNVIADSSGLPNSQNVRVSTGESSNAVTTTEMESSLNLGKTLGISDPATVSVILNGPITTGDLLTNHVQTSSAKGFSQAPSPRGSYVIPASPSSPASGVYCKTNQVTNQVDVSSAATTAMSPPTVFQRQTSTGSQQLGPLVNGTAPSPPAGSGVKGYNTNFVPKSSQVNTKGISSSPGHSMSNFVQGQTVVFANTNISQLQGQPISQSMTPQINQDKTHAQSNLFQRPLTSPGRTSCQPPSPQIPSPGRQSPQRSPSNAPSPKYQHSLYLNHQHIPVSTQAPIAQLKQQVENQGQQLQQIKFQQLQQQQSHNPQRQQNDQQQQQQSQQPLQHPKPPQYRAQQRIAPAPIQPSQQTTYLLQQSQPNHTLSLRPANGQVLKTSNAVFITNDNPPREIQFSLSRNAANTVG